MFFNNRNRNFYFNSIEENSYIDFGRRLSEILKDNCYVDTTIVLLCIGTDKCVGDSLGPLIGHMLENKFATNRIRIYGTLTSPVHACNLESTIDFIHSSIPNPFIIAVDASLGVAEHIGFATVKNGPLKPGIGVKKHLPEVGDVCITGIVNRTSSKNEASLFNSTRLSTVMFLADYISSAIYYCFENFTNVSAGYQSFNLRSPSLIQPIFLNNCPNK